MIFQPMPILPPCICFIGLSLLAHCSHHLSHGHWTDLIVDPLIISSTGSSGRMETVAVGASATAGAAVAGGGAAYYVAPLSITFFLILFCIFS
jgi:hypothetical protein